MSVFKKDVGFLAICLMCWLEGICHDESQSETDKLSCYDDDQDLGASTKVLALLVQKYLLY